MIKKAAWGLISLTLILLPVFSYAQLVGVLGSEDQSNRLDRMYQLFLDNEYYDCIDEIDNYYKLYPWCGKTWYLRGISHYFLGEVYEARHYFTVALKYHLGDEMKETATYISDDRAFAKWMAESYFDDFDVEVGEDLKIITQPKDTLQGSLRNERSCYDVRFYEITIRIDADDRSISGNTDIYFEVIDTTKKIQVDLFDIYDILSLKMGEVPLKYDRLYNAIFIETETTLLPGEQHIMSIEYSGTPIEAPSPPWNGGFVWKRYKRKHWVGVACEHLGASSWWPNKDHLSDKPDSVRINVQVPAGYMGISNGDLESTSDLGDGYKNFEWFVEYPINNYNITLYMGDFVNFNETYTNENGSYAIDYYVLPKHLKDAKKYYDQTSDVVNVYEKIFGEYPYVRDGIGMVEAPYAGMEHQGAIAIGDDYGKNKRREYDPGIYDYLVVHELAHEWWGNCVAINDMADAWINEGFATYAEALFIEELFGYEEYLNTITIQMSGINNLFPLVGRRDVNDNTFYTGDIYHKGAATLHNLRCIINNDTLFHNMIRAIFQEFKHSNINTRDIIDFMNDYTGHDLSTFFDIFLFSKEPPVLKYQFNIEDSILHFYYHWIKVKEDFKMPFAICVNEDTCIRLIATAEPQLFYASGIYDFYIPNEFHYKRSLIPDNSLTYFWKLRDSSQDPIAYTDADRRGIGEIQAGVPVGEWKYFYPDHTVKETVRYKNGIFEGEARYFNKDGTLRCEGSYSHGKRTGLWKFNDPAGRPRFSLVYHEDKAAYNDARYLSNSGDTYVPDTLSWVDSPPDFNECNTNIYTYLNDRMNERLPEGITPGSGMIIASFYVMPDGELTGISIEKSFDEILSPIFIEVLEEMPPWYPGYHQGDPVVVKMGLPVKFTPNHNSSSE